MMTAERFPWQSRAVEKLRRLRVGALYTDMPRDRAKVILRLIRLRHGAGKIQGVLWLCASHRLSPLGRALRREVPDLADAIHLVGLEGLSHSALQFVQAMEIARAGPVMLVVEESTLVKNPATLRFRRVAALARQCPYRLIATEIPFTRNVADLFAQWYLLDWRILGYRTHWSFAANHLDGGGQGRHLPWLAAAMEPYLFQMLRAEMMESAGRREYLWRFPLDDRAMEEYRQVVQRFIAAAQYSRSGVYRLLHAAQHAACGRAVVQDYPMQTAPLYASPRDNPRLRALMEVLAHCGNARVLILYKYAHEREAILQVLDGREGWATQCQLAHGPPKDCDAQVLVYYSQHWDWEIRRTRVTGRDSAPVVINLVAAGTIDERIVRCVWRKENLAEALRAELAAQVPESPE